MNYESKELKALEKIKDIVVDEESDGEAIFFSERYPEIYDIEKVLKAYEVLVDTGNFYLYFGGQEEDDWYLEGWNDIEIPITKEEAMVLKAAGMPVKE